MPTPGGSHPPTTDAVMSADCVPLVIGCGVGIGGGGGGGGGVGPGKAVEGIRPRDQGARCMVAQYAALPCYICIEEHRSYLAVQTAPPRPTRRGTVRNGGDGLAPGRLLHPERGWEGGSPAPPICPSACLAAASASGATVCMYVGI